MPPLIGHEPNPTVNLGSGICSYVLMIALRVLTETYPVIRKRLACLGVAVGSTPNLSASHRAVITGGTSMIPQPVQK